MQHFLLSHKTTFNNLLFRYNLKRKVAPVTLDDFNGRMAKHEAQMKTINGEIKEPTGYCVACTKNFGTQKALENHKQSKKHMVTYQLNYCKTMKCI